MCEEQKNCVDLTQKILAIMREDGYAKRTTDRRLKSIYNKLTKFCADHNDGLYSPEIGEEFLVECEKMISDRHYSFDHRHAIERVNLALVGDFHYRPVAKKDVSYASSCFDEQLAIYEKQLYESGKTKQNVRHRMHVLARFMKYAQNHGCSELTDMDVRIIYGGFESEGSKDEFRKTVVHFLRYVYRRGLIAKDLSRFVPEFSRHKPIPTVYSMEEISALLKSIDRTK